MGADVHRPAARGRGRRPAHVPGPHPRDRFRLVPAPDEPNEAQGGSTSGLINDPIGQSHRSGVGPVLMITVGPNGVVIPRRSRLWTCPLGNRAGWSSAYPCLLYTSDAADE